MRDQNEIVDKVEEEIEEVVDNSAAKTEEVVEAVEKSSEAVQEQSEESVEDALAEGKADKYADLDLDSQIEKLNKHDASLLLVKKAKNIVYDAENQLEQCKLLLANDLQEYENGKQELKDKGMDASEALLSKLGYVAEESPELREDTVVFEPKEELAPIRIEEISGGGFTGFLLALIAGFATLAGMVFLATEKLNMTLYLDNIPTAASMTPIMNWYASLVGMGDNPAVGGAIIGLAVLIVMWIVYKIRVSIKARSNLRMARAQLEAAEEYSLQKGTCKEEMDKVDAYIHEAIETLNIYQVIFNEQKGKLERILHIEKDKIESADFHHKSNLVMKDTQELISVIKDFMSVPMSEEGKLSGKSSLFLHRAKSRIQRVIEGLY